MLKWFLALAIALVVLTVLSPWLSRYGLGRLPGDLTVRYKGWLYYLPFASTILFFQAEAGIRRATVTGVQTCALPISDSIHVRLVEALCKHTGVKVAV